MKYIKSFELYESEQALDEGMSKAAIKKQIKVIDKMIDDETGGDGEPLTSETLQDLERERERLEKLLKEEVTLSEAATLVDEETGKVVKLPYKTKDFRGDAITVTGFTEPRNSGSSGRIQTDQGEYYPGVAGVKIIGHKFESINEGNVYDVPEFAHLSKSGKKLTVEFYNLDDWDSSMYGGGKGHKQAMKDIKMASKGENDPLLDDIEMHLGTSGLGDINWDKPIKVKDGGSSLEFVIESVNEAKIMSRKDIQKLVKELVHDGRHGDEAAFDLADGILYDTPGLEAGIRKHFGVGDPQGWLADRIA